MLTIVILVSIVLATALLFAVLVGAVLFVLTASNSASGSGNCNFCRKDSPRHPVSGNHGCERCSSMRL